MALMLAADRADRRAGQRRRCGNRRPSRHGSGREGRRPALPEAWRPRGDQPRAVRRSLCPGITPRSAGDTSRRWPETGFVCSTGTRWRRSLRSTRRAPTRSRSPTPGSPTARPPAAATGSSSATSRTRPRRLRPLLLAAEGGASQLSPPAVDGSILLYAIATPQGQPRRPVVMGTQQAPRAGALAAAAALRSRRQSASPSPTSARARRSRLMVRARHRRGAGRVLVTPETLCGRALVERTDRFRRIRDRAGAEGEQYRRHHHRSGPQTPEAPTRGAAPRGREQPVLIP